MEETLTLAVLCATSSATLWDYMLVMTDQVVWNSLFAPQLNMDVLNCLLN
jgi:hypothetical protein